MLARLFTKVDTSQPRRLFSTGDIQCLVNIATRFEYGAESRSANLVRGPARSGLYAFDRRHLPLQTVPFVYYKRVKGSFIPTTLNDSELMSASESFLTL